jgi:hypothetical protein
MKKRFVAVGLLLTSTALSLQAEKRPVLSPESRPPIVQLILVVCGFS